MSRFAHWCLIIIAMATILVASLLVIVPAISVSYVDWSHPNHVEWRMQDGERVVDEDGKGKVSVDYSDGIGQNLNHFYDKLDFPWRPSITEIILICVGLGLLFLVLENLLDYFYKDLDVDVLLWMVVVLQVLVWFLVFGINFATTGSGTHFTPTIQGLVNDEELVKAAVETSKQYAGSRGVVGAFLAGGSILALDIIALAIWGSFVGSVTVIKKCLRKYLLSGIEGVFLYDRVLSLQGDLVILYDVQIRNKLGFLPAVQAKRIAQVTFRKFTNLIVHQAGHSLVNQFHSRIEDSVATEIRTIEPQVIQTYGERVLSRVTQRSLPLLRQAQRNNGNDIEGVKALLQTTSDQTLSRFQQDLVAGIAGVINDSLTTFRETVREQFASVLLGGWLAAQNTGREEIYPDGVRFLFAEGDTTIVVVEEKPQVRTVFFADDILRDEDVELEKDQPGLQLAFPYTVFLIVFREGYFDQLCVFYRTEPLATLDDRLLRPNLPNVASDGFVCLQFPDRFGKRDTLAERVESVMSYFWQSYFNTHMSADNYRPYRLRDRRLDGLRAWEKASKDDMLFVFDVNWFATERNLRGLIRELSRHATDTSVGRLEQIITDALFAGQDKIGELVQTYCGNLKVENRYPRTISDAVAVKLGELQAGFSKIFTEELEKLARDETVHQVDLVAAIQTSVSRALGRCVDPTEANLRPSIDPYDLYYVMNREGRVR